MNKAPLGLSSLLNASKDDQEDYDICDILKTFPNEVFGKAYSFQSNKPRSSRAKVVLLEFTDSAGKIYRVLDGFILSSRGRIINRRIVYQLGLPVLIDGLLFNDNKVETFGTHLGNLSRQCHKQWLSENFLNCTINYDNLEVYFNELLRLSKVIPDQVLQCYNYSLETRSTTNTVVGGSPGLGKHN